MYIEIEKIDIHGLIPNTEFSAIINEIHISGVRDGDSFASSGTQLRLIGVDCPEQANPYVTKEQPYAREIANDVRSMFKGKLANIKVIGFDRYGRTLCKLEINGIDVSAHLLSKGYAWYMSTPVVSDRKEYRMLRDFAKKRKLGLWQDANPISPKKWRAMYKPL